MQLTKTTPVRAHIITVSQKVPDAETSACRTGFLVCAAAATMGAEPRPDSFENSPRAIPYLIATIIAEPKSPPPTASVENAESIIKEMASGT